MLRFHATGCTLGGLRKEIDIMRCRASKQVIRQTKARILHASDTHSEGKIFSKSSNLQRENIRKGKAGQTAERIRQNGEGAGKPENQIVTDFEVYDQRLKATALC